MIKSIFRSMKIAIAILLAFLFVMTFACTGDEASSISITSLTPLNEVSYPVKNFSVTTREPSIAENGKEVEINVFSTNDEHGWIFDWDFGQESPRMSKGKPYHCGLARISTLYKKLSTENSNSMIVSAGDSIQGTILSYYFNFLKTDIENPISAIFKKIGYSTWTIGNHEVEQGNDVILKVVKEMKAGNIAVLSANAVWSNNTEKPYYLPYTIKEIDGVRVGILGLTTPGIPLWLSDKTHENHIFLDMVETTKKYVPILREQEKVDVLVGVFHSGMNEAYDIDAAAAVGVPAPNASSLVAKEIGGGPTGFDAIITAHSHKIVDDTTNTEYRDPTPNVINGVTFIQAMNWGEKLGQIKIKVVGENDKWIVKSVNAMTHSVANVEEDPEILEFMKPYIDGAKGYAATPVGEILEDMPFERSLLEESAVVDLIHETQRYFTKAEISIAASFGSEGLIPKGKITVGNIAKIYIYENFLNAIELTGQQIKDYLEFSSNYYNVITEDNVDTTPLVNPDVKGYNYDMAQGFLYEIDITKKPGNRIVNMKNMDGTPFDLEKKYSVTLNSYRYNGGGFHLENCGAMQKGILKVKTLYSSTQSMRDLMVEYIKYKKQWGPENIEYNWKLVPESLAKKAIEKELARN